MKSSGFEGCDPNYGICPDAVEVLTWQALACTALTRERSRGILRSGQIINSCERCVGGSLLLGDESKLCRMAGKAIEFTALGPAIDDPPMYDGPYPQDRIS